MAPINRNNEQKITGVLEYQQHEELTRSRDQLSPGNVEAEVCQRIFNQNAGKANQLIRNKTTYEEDAEHLQYRGSSPLLLCVHGPQYI